MMHTLLGPEKFRAGADLYFERHDGQAVTCEDFVRAMEDASGVDLSQFRTLVQPGGHAAGQGERGAARAARRGSGSSRATPPTPGQPAKQPVPIPLKLALFGAETGAKQDDRLVLLDEAAQELVIEGVGERPILSINRGFSAPIVVETDRGADDLAFLSAHDDDPFARYEAMQQLMLDTLLAAIATGAEDHAPVVEAVREHADRSRARSGLRRRGGAGADRKLHRRPDEDGRSRRDPRRPRAAARTARHATSSRSGAPPMPRPPPTASNCRRPPRARGGCGRWRSAS